jgi:hypothetical protein
MKKALTLIAISLTLLTGCSGSNTMEFSYERPKGILEPVAITESTTCIFNYVQSADFNQQSDKINYSFSKQSSPIIITFIDLNTETPKSKSNNGQGTLIKLRDTEDSFLVSEAEPLLNGVTIIYEIFKNENVATWSKTYKFPISGIPLGTFSMGFCD